MKSFVRRWADWPRRSSSEIVKATLRLDFDTSARTGTQRTDKTDRTSFGGFVSSLPVRSSGFFSPVVAPARCAQCHQREAMGVAVVGCGACGFRRSRRSWRRPVTGRARRGHPMIDGDAIQFRLIEGGGGDD